jgi:transketolase
MTVICPADANETVAATKAIAAFDGPVYLRVNGNDYENVTAEGAKFVIGEPTVLREGNDVAVFATGITVGMAIKAAEELNGRISVKVINVSTIKPLEPSKIVALAGSCKAVVCAEEHSIIGGLGGAIAEAMRRSPKPMEFVGIDDVYGCSDHNYSKLLEHFGITTKNIAEAIIKMDSEA